MQQSPPFNDMICSTAERILKSLSPEGSSASDRALKDESASPPALSRGSAAAEGRLEAAADSSGTGDLATRGETTSWDIKMNLHLSSSTLYLALGWLCSQGRVTMEPYELTYRVRRSEATTSCQTKQSADQQSPSQGPQNGIQHETQPIG